MPQTLKSCRSEKPLSPAAAASSTSEPESGQDCGWRDRLCVGKSDRASAVSLGRQVSSPGLGGQEVSFPLSRAQQSACLSHLWNVNGFPHQLLHKWPQHPCRERHRAKEESVFALESKQYALKFAFQNWEMSLSKLPTPCRKDKGTFYSAQNKKVLAVLTEHQPCTII